MSVIECKMLDSGGVDYSKDRSNHRTYKVVFQIETSTMMGPSSAKVGAMSTSSGFMNPLPREGDPCIILGDYDPYAFVKSINMKRVDVLRWQATVNYETLPPGQKEEDFDTDPMARPPKYRKGRLVSTRRVTVDKDGKPIANSAGQEFSETFEEEVSYPLLIATINVATLDELFIHAAEWEGKVSSTTYRTFSARKWLVLSIEAGDEMSENDIEFYQETWTLGLNVETWDMKALDRGWKVLVGGQLVDATDDEGAPVNEPVMLIDGAKATTLVPPDTPIEGTHYNILSFRWRGEKSFDDIPV